jgi:outer membrane protein TolC
MRYVYFLIPILFFYNSARAQESLAQEISLPYLEKLIEVAKANYPRMKMYDSRIDMGIMGVKKAKLSYFDILSFSYLYSPTQSAATINPGLLQGYQFGFFVNIGSLVQKPTLIKQAKAEVQVTRYEKEAFELNLEADIKKRYFTYIQNKALLRIKSDGLLDIESLLKETRYKFEKGEATLQNYNNALLMYSTQLQTKISTEAELYISKSNLEELVGQKLENIK